MCVSRPSKLPGFCFSPIHKSQCTRVPLRLVWQSQRLLSHRWPGVGRTTGNYLKCAESDLASVAFEANPLGAKWMTAGQCANVSAGRPLPFLQSQLVRASRGGHRQVRSRKTIHQRYFWMLYLPGCHRSGGLRPTSGDGAERGAFQVSSLAV